MKKLIVLAALFATVYSANAQQASANTQSNTNAQGGGDAAAMAERVRQTKATLVEKAKITEEQAEKIMQINIDARKSLGDMRELSDDDRKAKIAAMEADRDKKYLEVLTQEQFTAVKTAFADMKKQHQPQQRQGN